MDEFFGGLLEKCRGATMTSPERMYALYRLVRLTVENDIPGDFVECGVWRGGSVMIMAETLAALGVTDRTIWLYDTFEGMPPPDSVDRDVSGTAAQALLEGEERSEGSDIWAYAPLQVVEDNLRRTAYPFDRFRFVVGKVEDTIPAQIPSSIALLRLDTDWYSSTAWELKHLYPLLSPGGPLVLDDYGHWVGARQAVDEYFADEPIKLVPIDYTGRMMIKPRT